MLINAYMHIVNKQNLWVMDPRKFENIVVWLGLIMRYIQKKNKVLDTELDQFNLYSNFKQQKKKKFCLELETSTLYLTSKN